MPSVPDRRGAAQRAPALQVPRAVPHRPPRPARRRRPRDDHPGAVAAGRRVSGAGPAMVEPALHERYGRPTHVGPDGQRTPTGFAVIGMGKLGGAELNYSSDIDLCFVYEDEGETDGPEIVSSRTYFARLAEQLVGALTAMTEEGTVFRVDLRLRPEGTGGPLALPLDGYRAYHATRGALWERQALIKARMAAGDERVGQAFHRPGARDRLPARARARGARGDPGDEEPDRPAAARARASRSATSSSAWAASATSSSSSRPSSSSTAGRIPGCASGTACGPSSGSPSAATCRQESGRLAHGYVFLRTVEHRLQILHELQTHTLPADPDELAKLARRLGYTGDRAAVAHAFLARLRPDARGRSAPRSRVLRRVRRGRRRRRRRADAAARGRRRLRRSRARAPEPPAALGRAGAGRGPGGRPDRAAHAAPRHARRARDGRPIPTRPSTRSSASSPPRGRGRPTSRGWPRPRRCSAGCSRSSRGRSGSRRC